jgi:hypothetical protein
MQRHDVLWMTLPIGLLFCPCLISQKSNPESFFRIVDSRSDRQMVEAGSETLSGVRSPGTVWNHFEPVLN